MAARKSIEARQRTLLGQALHSWSMVMDGVQSIHDCSPIPTMRQIAAHPRTPEWLDELAESAYYAGLPEREADTLSAWVHDTGRDGFHNVTTLERMDAELAEYDEGTTLLHVYDPYEGYPHRQASASFDELPYDGADAEHTVVRVRIPDGYRLVSNHLGETLLEDTATGLCARPMIALRRDGHAGRRVHFFFGQDDAVGLPFED